MYDQVKLLYENQLWSNLCQFGSLTLGMTKNGELAAQSSFTTGSSAASAGAPSSPEASSSNSFVPGPSTSCAASSSSSSSSSGATASSSSSSSSCSSSPLLLQLSPKERVYLLSMVAEAYFVTQNFANAEVLFKEALQVM